jgi:DNA-binding IscR family transcriptional regulator
VTLLGSEVAFAVQHWRTYEGEVFGKAMNFRTRSCLALLIMKDVINRFKNGEKWSPDAFAEKNILSPKSVLEVAHSLDERNLLERVQGDDILYFPAKMVSQISAAEVVEVIAGERSDVLQGMEKEDIDSVMPVGNQWQKFLAEIRKIKFSD